MKLFSAHVLSLCLFVISYVSAQDTYCYELANNLESSEEGVPALTLLPNGNGQSGRFRSIVAPSNWCSELGVAEVFEFEDNVGLAFDNSDGFIDCAYTVEFVVNFYELPQNTLFDAPWIWLFGTSNEDDGIFLHRNALFNIRALEFWDDNDRLRSVAFPDMNTKDWFHYTITRDCEGLVSVYINCQLFTTFNDTRNILSLRPETGNKMIFFQDDPGTLSAETSPGLVRNIKISNFVRPESDILANCDCICESLTSECDIEATIETSTCDPTEAGTFVEQIPYNGECGCSCDSTITRIVTLLPTDSCEMNCQVDLTIDTTFCAGAFFMDNALERDTIICQEVPGVNCDTIRYYNIMVLPKINTNLQEAICSGESFLFGDSTYTTAGVYQQTFASSIGCDSMVTLNLVVSEPQTITTDSSVCAGTIFENIPVFNDTTICQTLQNEIGCDSTICYNIIITESIETIINSSICPGETYILGNISYTMPGIYTTTLTAISGCDSVVVLNLDFIEPVEEQRDTVICNGTLFLGNIIEQDTTICQNLQTSRSCDSTICYNVLLLEPKYSEISERICEGDSYALGDTSLEVSGVYKAVFTSSEGCDSTVVLNLTVDTIPVTYIDVPICRDTLFDDLLFTQDTVVCQTSARSNDCDSTICLNIRLIDPPTSTLEAEICPDEIFVYQDSVYIAPGTYQYIFYNTEGCDSTVTITLTERPSQSLSITGDTLICKGGNTILNAGAGFISYEWNIPDEDGQTLQVNQAGNYAVMATDIQGCTYEGEIEVQETPELFVKISTVQPVSCPEMEDAILLAEAAGGIAPYNFEWNNGANTEEITRIGSGNYTVSITDGIGCQTEGMAEVVNPPTFDFNINTTPPSCFGLDNGVITVDIAGTNTPFLYAINNLSFQNTSVFSNLIAGEYEVKVQDANGCEQSQVVLLEAAPAFDLSIIPEVAAIIAGDSVELNVISSQTILEQINWSPTQFLSCDTCQTVVAFPLSTTTYTVNATNTQGCQSSIMVTVKVSPKDKEALQVFVPTAFSPNGDGVNDYLTVFGGEEATLVEVFQIFDRWGNLLYERNNFSPNNESEGWDGTFYGEMLSSSVFVWSATVVYTNEEREFLYGHVTLMK